MYVNIVIYYGRSSATIGERIGYYVCKCKIYNMVLLLYVLCGALLVAPFCFCFRHTYCSLALEARSKSV